MASKILKVIGIYEILTGGLGLLFIIFFSLPNFQINIFWLLYELIAIIVASFSIIAGFKTFRLQHNGLTYSTIIQITQLVGLSVFGFNYYMSLGIGMFAGIDLSADLSLYFKTSLFYYSLGSKDPAVYKIGINITPLLLIILVESLRKKRTLSEAVSFSFE